MMPVKHLDIAVIGDEDLVNGLRLAGINRYYVMEDGNGTREEVRKVLSELLSDSSVAIIAILEDYTGAVEDLLSRVREGKKGTPVVVEIPSKYGTRYRDVGGYYKGYVKKFLGFDIEI